MNIKASFYDIFAYTIPGGMLLLIILHGMKMFEFGDYFTILQNANFFTLFTFGVTSHIVGFLIDPITYYLAKDFKSKEKTYSTAYKEVISRNPDLDNFINPADWAIWFAKIKKESIDVANEIDQFLAYSKMIRGVCFALLLSSLLLTFYVLLGKLNTYCLLSLPILGVLILLSLRQAKKFKLGFYILIFETIISRKPPFTMPDEVKLNK